MMPQDAPTGVNDRITLRSQPIDAAHWQIIGILSFTGSCGGPCTQGGSGEWTGGGES